VEPLFLSADGSLSLVARSLSSPAEVSGSVDHHSELADRTLKSVDHHSELADRTLKSVDHHSELADRTLKSVDHHLELADRTLKSVDHHLELADRTLKSVDHHLELAERTLKSAGSTSSLGGSPPSSVDSPRKEVRQSLTLFAGDTRKNGRSPLSVAGPLSSKISPLLSKNGPVRSLTHADSPVRGVAP
jgi:hypothetical protein